MPRPSQLVAFTAAKLLVPAGILALILGLALVAFVIPAGWLGWSGAILSMVALATMFLLDRSMKRYMDRTAEEGLTTIYMPLLDEGVDVWRPVEAQKISDLGYMVTEYAPPNEVWAFQPGHILRCEERLLRDGPQLVAVAKAT